MDYYQTLGINREATSDEIKTAYRKLAKQYHPDRNQNNAKAEEKFKSVQEAYDVLIDPQKRQTYDQYGTSNPMPNGNYGSGDPFASIFESFFGPSRRQSADVKIEHVITLEDIASGTEKTIKYQRGKTCTACRGLGGSGKKCEHCNGYGHVQKSFDFLSTSMTCQHCKGKGIRITQPCDTCHGHGSILESRQVTLKIPENIQNGMGIRFQGGGHQIGINKPYGDLICYFRVANHPVFRRIDNNLYYTASISIVQACLGGTVDVPTINGTDIKLKIPAGTQQDQRFNVKGKGLSGGSLFVDVNIVIPTNLPDKAKQLLKELKQFI